MADLFTDDDVQRGDAALAGMWGDKGEWNDEVRAVLAAVLPGIAHRWADEVDGWYPVTPVRVSRSSTGCGPRQAPMASPSWWARDKRRLRSMANVYALAKIHHAMYHRKLSVYNVCGCPEQGTRPGRVAS